MFGALNFHTATYMQPSLKLSYCYIHADITDDVSTDWRWQQLRKNLKWMKQRVTFKEMIATAVTTVTHTYTHTHTQCMVHVCSYLSKNIYWHQITPSTSYQKIHNTAPASKENTVNEW